MEGKQEAGAASEKGPCPWPLGLSAPQPGLGLEAGA